MSIIPSRMVLRDLLKHPEGKTLEFKRYPSLPDGALKMTVVFAVKGCFTLLIGVEDRCHTVLSAADPHYEEKRLANLISGARNLPQVW